MFYQGNFEDLWNFKKQFGALSLRYTRGPKKGRTTKVYFTQSYLAFVHAISIAWTMTSWWHGNTPTLKSKMGNLFDDQMLQYCIAGCCFFFFSPCYFFLLIREIWLKFYGNDQKDS